MPLTTLSPEAIVAEGVTKWVASEARGTVIALAVATFGALSMVAAYLLEHEWWGTAQLLAAIAGVLTLFLAPLRVSPYVSVVSMVVFAGIELLSSGYANGVTWYDVGRLLAFAATLLAASMVRVAIRRRETELAVAGAAIRELTERDKVVQLLAGSSEPSWLEAELARAQRHNHHMALVLVRPDRFAELASFGADVHQEVLEAVAEVIGSEVRAIDIALRHQPATFALILAETPTEGARIVAERIRLTLPSRLGTLQHWRATLSIGVATFPEDASTHDELINCAERALDRALELGGNRTVCVSAPPTAPPGWTLEGAQPH